MHEHRAGRSRSALNVRQTERPTGPYYMNLPRRVILVLVLSATACRDAAVPTPTPCCRRSFGEWSYAGEPRAYVDGQWRYDFVLKYRGKPLTVPGTLGTPIGCLSNRAALDQWDASGWKAGFDTCESDIPPRPPGIPPSWVLWKGIAQPGWVDPANLFDPEFVERRAQSKSTNSRPAV